MAVCGSMAAQKMVADDPFLKGLSRQRSWQTLFVLPSSKTQGMCVQMVAIYFRISLFTAEVRRMHPSSTAVPTIVVSMPSITSMM